MNIIENRSEFKWGTSNNNKIILIRYKSRAKVNNSMFADDIEFVEKERVTRHEVNQEPFKTEMFAKEIRS